MTDYVVALLHKHRARGILVDTNILLLLFVGLFDRGQISTFKRTKNFSPDDYDVLAGFVSCFDRIVTTPHILSEVSNLSGQMGEPHRSKYFAKFAVGISLLAEEYVVSAEAAKRDEFPRLGLADSGIMHLVRDKYLVLTDDFTLYGHLQKAGVDSLNFNHLRPIS